MSVVITPVDLFVDPCCPFAWTASRWLLEVRRQRALDLQPHLMNWPCSTKIRTSRRSRALMERAWAPARVAAAAVHCRRLALDTTDLAERT